MKKLRNLFKTILVILILAVGSKAYAASGSLSVSTGSVYVGDSFTASVNVSSAAAWEVHVSATGPVTNCSINEAGYTDDATDTSRTFTANCVATGEGTISISLSGNATGANDDEASYFSGSRTVTVSKKPEPEPTPTPTPDNNNNNNQENKPEEKKSNNNKIKEISIEGYSLVKVNDNNYTLSVDNKVEKINIKASAEDAKATVTGTGEKTLKVGENTIEIVIKAEDGTENKITIKVTREEEKKVAPTKHETKKDTKKDTSDNKKDLKINLLLIILFVLDIVLAVTVIILALQNNKLRKNRY